MWEPLPNWYNVTFGLYQTSMGIYCPSGMSQNHESVPFVRWVLLKLTHTASAGVSQSDKHWLTLAGDAAVSQRYDIDDRCAFSSSFSKVCQLTTTL